MSHGQIFQMYPHEHQGLDFRGHPSVDHIEHGVVKQPGHRHWVIFDQIL